MTKAEFSQLIAQDKPRFGLWSEAANLAIKDGRTDLHVQHWIEQYDDPGSRPTVERMLGPELTEFIKQQSDKGMNEDTSK